MQTPILIEEIGKDRRSHRIGRYRCQCGNEFETQVSNVDNLRTRSCGCLRRTMKNHATHKLSSHRLYKVWWWIKQVCNNQKHLAYRKFGGSGLRYPESWEEFECFYQDMISEYKHNHWIRLVDPKEHFSKDNCYWAPIKIYTKKKR
jgi:hypothetical protein